MSEKRTPTAAQTSLAKFITANGTKITAAQVEAVDRLRAEWRKSPERQLALEAQREAANEKKRAQIAKLEARLARLRGETPAEPEAEATVTSLAEKRSRAKKAVKPEPEPVVIEEADDEFVEPEEDETVEVEFEESDEDEDWDDSDEWEVDDDSEDEDVEDF